MALLFYCAITDDLSTGWANLHTIIAQAANVILGKLHFYVIISSTINPKLKRPPIRIDERNLRLLTTAEKR